jgi:hypothetical protein
MEKCKYNVDEIKEKMHTQEYYEAISYLQMENIEYRIINEYVYERGLDSCAKLFIYTKQGVACFYVIEKSDEKIINFSEAHLVNEEDFPGLERLLQKEKEKVKTLEFILKKQRIRRTVGREKT